MLRPSDDRLSFILRDFLKETIDDGDLALAVKEVENPGFLRVDAGGWELLASSSSLAACLDAAARKPPITRPEGHCTSSARPSDEAVGNRREEGGWRDGKGFKFASLSRVVAAVGSPDPIKCSWINCNSSLHDTPTRSARMENHSVNSHYITSVFIN